MKKTLKILAIIVIISIASIIIITKQDNKNEKAENNYNETETKDNEGDVDNLKEEYKITGDDDIYEVIEDTSGRKMLTVKASINFKVAFSGMIKNSEPKKEEIDNTPAARPTFILLNFFLFSSITHCKSSIYYTTFS